MDRGSLVSVLVDMLVEMELAFTKKMCLVPGAWGSGLGAWRNGPLFQKQKTFTATRSWPKLQRKSFALKVELSDELGNHRMVHVVCGL